MWAFSGVRPLYDDGKSDPSSITRDYVLKLDAGAGGAEPPVLSIYGGKLTTYRKLAEAALAALQAPLPGDARPLDRRATRSRAATCRDTTAPRGSPSSAGATPVCRRRCSTTLAAATVRARPRVLGDAKTPADLGRDFGNGLCEREVDWFVREEWAKTRRRCPLAAHQGGIGMDAAGRDALAAHLGG